MDMFKKKKSANILGWAESIKIKCSILNLWYKKQREPYLFHNYEHLIQYNR